MKKKILYWTLIGIFALIFIFSGAIVVDYIMDSYEHQQLMEDIRNLHTIGPESSSTVSGSIVAPTVTRPSSSADPTVPGSSVIPTVPFSTGTVPSDPEIPTTLPDFGSESTQPTIPSISTTPTIPATQPTEPAPTEPTTQPTEPTPTEPTVPQPSFPTKPSILPEMKAVYDLNNDVVGWIKIKDTNIDYPVLQKKTIADYYIYRNIYGEYDKRGCIYAEEHCDVFEPSDVVVLHGHHMGDGSMFNNLKYYKYASYFKARPYVYFDTLYERRTYQVVLVFRTNGAPHDTYPFFPFHSYNNFKDEDEFNYFMSSIRALALQESGVEVKYGDKLLCLSTCDYSPYPNGRMVLVAKLIE